MKKACFFLATVALLVSATLVFAAGSSERASSTAPIVLKYARGGNHSPSPENARVKAAIEAKFLQDTGVRVDLQPVYYDWDNFTEKFNVDVAGGTAPDSVRFWPAQHYTNWFAGDYIGLSDLVAKYAPNMQKRFTPDEISWATVNGTLTGLPMGGKPINYLAIIRTDKLKQYGLQMPTTLDQLEHVMDVYHQKEPNNPSYPDYYAALIRYASALAELPMDNNSLYVKDDGTVTSVYLHPNQTRYIGLLAKWYQNGWIMKDALTIGEDAEKLFMQGHGLLVDSYAQYGFDFFKTLKKNDPNAAGAIVPELTTQWGDKSLFLDGFNSEGYDGILKTTKPDVAAALVKFYNWELNSRANFMMTRYGEEGTDYTMNSDGSWSQPAKWKAAGAQPYGWEYVLTADPFLAGGDLEPPNADDPAGVQAVYDQIRNAIKNHLYVDNPIKRVPTLPLGDAATTLAALNQKLGQLQSEIIYGKRPLSDWGMAAQIWQTGGGAAVDAAATKAYQQINK